MCCSPCGRYARVAINAWLGCRRTARRDGQLEEPHRYGFACRGSNKGEKYAAAGRLEDEAENDAANESTRNTNTTSATTRSPVRRVRPVNHPASAPRMTNDTQPAPRVGFCEQVGVHAGAHQDLIILFGRQTFCGPKCAPRIGPVSPPRLGYPRAVDRILACLRSHGTDWFGTPLAG